VWYTLNNKKKDNSDNFEKTINAVKYEIFKFENTFIDKKIYQ